MTTVYCITNLINGKKYVGVTGFDPAVRWKQHCLEAQRGSPRALCRAICKYGPGMFRISKLIDNLSFARGLAEERRLVSIVNPAYNMTEGGEGVLGMVHTSATREKMAAAKRGRVGPMKGKTHSAQTRAKLSAARIGKPGWGKGVPKSAGVRAKISAAKKGIPRSASFPPHALAVFADNMRRAAVKKRRSVACVEDEIIFPSLTEAAAFYGTNKSNVLRAVKNPHYKIGGRSFVRGECVS